MFNTLYAPYKIGGAELSVQTLAEGFVSRGHNVGVVTLGEKDEIVVVNGVRIWRLKIYNSFWPFDNVRKGGFDKLRWHINDVYNKSYKNQFQRIINAFSPDIIHTNNLAGLSVFIWDLANKNQIRIVHTLRDYYLQCVRTTKFKNNKVCSNSCLECGVLSYSKKRFSKYVDVVVGLSNYILEDHLEKGYFPNAEQVVIFNGFKLPPEDEKSESISASMENYIRFGYIGRMDISKGINLLVDSLKELKVLKNWELSIAGNSKLETQIDFERKLGERVKFLGYVDPEMFFNKIDVIVVPSIWNEPFGRVVIEGLIHKKIVIGSKRGGIPQLLNFDNDFLFEPTISDLKKLLEIIIKGGKNYKKFNFNHDLLREFKSERIIDKYLELF